MVICGEGEQMLACVRLLLRFSQVGELESLHGTSAKICGPDGRPGGVDLAGCAGESGARLETVDFPASPNGFRSERA